MTWSSRNSRPKLSSVTTSRCYGGCLSRSTRARCQTGTKVVRSVFGLVSLLGPPLLTSFRLRQTFTNYVTCLEQQIRHQHEQQRAAKSKPAIPDAAEADTARRRHSHLLSVIDSVQTLANRPDLQRKLKLKVCVAEMQSRLTVISTSLDEVRFAPPLFFFLSLEADFVPGCVRPPVFGENSTVKAAGGGSLGVDSRRDDQLSRAFFERCLYGVGSGSNLSNSRELDAGLRAIAVGECVVESRSDVQSGEGTSETRV
jgi:hypothetical protein